MSLLALSSIAETCLYDATNPVEYQYVSAQSIDKRTQIQRVMAAAENARNLQIYRGLRVINCSNQLRFAGGESAGVIFQYATLRLGQGSATCQTECLYA
jgi:hypothetical protein